jgi:glycosyltransferase involved in cell wall biosynthesis
MFTNVFAPLVGGIERSVATAHEDLNRTGDFCTLVAPRFRSDDNGEDRVLRVPAITGLGRRGYSLPLPAFGRISQWMEAIRPTLVHAHQPFLLGGTALRVARNRGIPLVFSHHTFYDRYAHYLPLAGTRARRTVIRMTTAYANRADLIIVPTPGVREVLIERGVLAPIEVVPTGIDTYLYSSGCRMRGRHRFGLSPDHEVVGHLGRLSQEKNLVYLVDAMVHLMRRRPSVRWLLAGDGDRLHWARRRVAEAGLAHRLLTPGTLLGAATADAYAAMDLFVFASRIDTQGIVLAEAMSAGVPVLALDAPCVRDCVDDSVGVRLPANVNADCFPQTADSLLRDLPRRQALGAAARHHALRYSRPRCLRLLTSAYDRATSDFPALRREAASDLSEADEPA